MEHIFWNSILRFMSKFLIFNTLKDMVHLLALRKDSFALVRPYHPKGIGFGCCKRKK